MEYLTERIDPITREDWHSMIAEDSDKMPKPDLAQWVFDEETVDLGYDCIVRPYYVGRCYSIQHNDERYDDMWGWSCSIWSASEEHGLFEDVRAIKCNTPEEALEALFDSIAGCI